MSKSTSIRAVIFQEHGKWVGQCLEIDVGAQAETLERLLSNLEVAVATEKHVQGTGQAPQYYFDLWDRCSERAKNVKEGPDLSYALCA